MKQLLIIFILVSNCVFAKAQMGYSHIDKNINFEAFTSPFGTDSLELSIYIKFKSNALVPRTNLILSFSENQEEILVTFRNTCFVLIPCPDDYFEDIPADTLEIYKLIFPRKNKPIEYSFSYSYISKNNPDYSILQKEFKKVTNDMKTPSMKNKKLVTMLDNVKSLLVSTIYGSLSNRTIKPTE
ncbi:MAG: hypothetical protein QM530_06285 [Phycisphaerales bacterium]|nr:hypothetical protein [Phycisphaerales bacterium]